MLISERTFLSVLPQGSSKTAQHIREQIAACVGIPTCIGIAPTKTLAKVANHLAKKNPRYKGVCILEKASEIEAVLETFPIEEICYRLQCQLI